MNLALYKNTLLIVFLLTIFQCYSFHNVALFWDWAIYCIGIEAILIYCVNYKKMPEFSICIPLLIPWVYVFKFFHDSGYVVAFIQFCTLIYLIYDLYKHSQFKARRQWLVLFMIASYCVINNIWGIVLDQSVYWFIQPEQLVYLNSINKAITIRNNWALSFFPLITSSSEPLIAHLIAPLFSLALIVKSSIFVLWIVSWGTLYCLANLSHHNKIFTLSSGATISYGFWDKTILLFGFMYSLYHGWYYGGFTWVGFGIFCNEILILFLISSWLLVLAHILSDLKVIKSFSITLILAIPFIIEHSNIFNILHLWLSQYNFYQYKGHINSSLYMAFSATFLSWFLWMVPIGLIIYLLFILKKRLSLHSLISIIGACIFTLSIWSLHHFWATQIVNNSEEIRQTIFTQYFNNNKDIPSMNHTHDINILLKQLDSCKVCHIFPDKEFNHEKIKAVIVSSPERQFVNLIAYNVRLVDIVYANNTFFYNLHRSSEITFLSLSGYCLIYFPLFFFWLFLGIVLQVAHKKYFKTITTEIKQLKKEK